MMIINDKDVLAADVVVAEQIRQGHEICQPIARESALFVRLRQN